MKSLARVQEQASKLEHDNAHDPSDPQIPVNTFCPAVLRDRPSLLGLFGLLLAACICVVVIASQSSYGETAKLIIAQWAPQLVFDFIAAASRAAEPIRCSAGRGGAITSTTSTCG